jgi:hypothetical protein
VKTVGTVAATIINQGLISSPTKAAVVMVGGGYVSNAGTGVISGAGYGIKAANDPVTIVNAGSITAQSVAAIAVLAGGTISNTGSGAILGGRYGVVAVNAAATVFNQGSISGPGRAGVQLRDGGYVSNAGTGTITGAYFGVQIATVSASVANFGSISSAAVEPVGDRSFDAAGVDLAAGGIVSNGTAGDIRATWKGVEIGAVGTNAGGTVFNQGTIYASNSAGTTGAAVWIHGPGLIGNAATGTIAGGPYGGDAVHLYAGSVNRLVVDPGDAFSGVVDGGNTLGATAASTLELASGAAAGTLTGLGTTIEHFAQIAIDTGATWTLTADTLAAGYTINDAGTLINTGTLESAVTLGAGAALSNASGGLIDNTTGPAVYSAAGSMGVTVINAGSITGGGGFGIHLLAGGTVSNASTGRITATQARAIYIQGGAGTVLNAGTIQTTVGTYTAVVLEAGGYVSNSSTGLITSQFKKAIYVTGAAGSIVNFGTISNDAKGGAIYLNDGGSVTNAGTGKISDGGGNGILIKGTPGTLSNAGVVSAGGTGAGVVFMNGGTVTNAIGGTISSTVGIGVYITGTTGTVDNNWLIDGASNTLSGVDLVRGGSVTNQSGATISGFMGVWGVNAAITVANAGEILGNITASESIIGNSRVGAGVGIDLNEGGSVTNQSNALISGFNGIAANNVALTVVNGGTILGNLTTSYSGGTGNTYIPPGRGVYLGAGGSITNQSSAVIGGYQGIYDKVGRLTVVNDGAIAGGTTGAPNALGGLGILLQAGGSVTNQASGRISGYYGISIGNYGQSADTIVSGTVINAGTIIGANLGIAHNDIPAGVQLQGGLGGAVTNQSSGTITGYWGIVSEGPTIASDNVNVVNAGYIAGNATASSTITIGSSVYAVSGAGIWLRTAGTVTNQSTGSIRGFTGLYGGKFGAITAVNAGSISGSGGDAVRFVAGENDRLVVDPGAVFNGTVDGGNTLGATAVSTLELASGASTGSVTGFGSKYIDFARITVDAGATWSLTNNETFAPGVTLTDSGTVTLDGSVAPPEIGFAGTAAFVKLTDAAAFTGGMYRFGQGDMLDIGPATVGTIIQQYGQHGGPPVLTVLSNAGSTLFSAAFSGANGNPVGNATGTYAVNKLTAGAVVAGPFELLTLNGDTVLEELSASTWSWTGADPSNVQDPANWTLVSGPGNQQGSPNQGDTVQVNNGTLSLPRDNNLAGNTLYLTGTSEMSFVGDQTGYITVKNGNSQFVDGISNQNPTVDGATLITNDPTVSPADTTLNFAGYTVNQGRIVSDGSPGSTLTLNVTQDGTAPGYFLNYGEIEADAGNTVTITIAGTSELFNANLIYANGGKVVVNGGTGIAGGIAPMLGGVALIGAGGTLVYDAGFPSGTEGSSPIFAFYDNTSGNTLKLEQLGQFSGRILGFQQGDTIDLGSTLSIGTIVVSSDGQLLLESSGSVDTLVLSYGAYNIGTYAVTAVSAGTFAADGFTLTTGADGDTLLTTGVVDDVWNGTSGVWQTASAWSGNVVPGTSSAAIIGFNTAGADGTVAPFVLTTGSVAVDVNSLSLINSDATLQITSNTTVGTSTNEYPIQQIAGVIEITGGNTLTATLLKQGTPAADLQIDAGGVLDLTGHSDLGFVNDGTLSAFTVVNGITFANGNTLAMFVEGTVTVDDGTINAGPVLSGANVVSTGGLISIGQDGGGTPAAMTVENGATVTDTYGFLSSDPTSFGSLTLTGDGTTWDDESDPTDTYNTRGYMIVGGDNQASNQPSPTPSGTAQLLVENGAVLNEYSHAEIGESADSAGSATITAGGVWNIGTSGASGGPGGFLNVGDAGSGTLVVDDGGTVNILAGSGTFTLNGSQITDAAGMAIAHEAGGDGTVDVSGDGQLNITVSPTISGSGFGVGQYGHGVLDIFNGGTVSITGGGISAGSDTTVIAVGTTVAGDGTIIVCGTFGAGGTVESSGGASSVLMTSGGGAGIGKAGTGTLYVETGGTVQVSGGGIDVGESAGAHGLAVINGGLVKDTSSGLNVGDSGTGTLELINSGTISLTGGGIDIGASAGAQGLLEIASGGLLTSTTNGMDVGLDAGSSGTLEVVDGGIYNISTHSISAGVSAGATGTILRWRRIADQCPGGDRQLYRLDRTGRHG